MSDLHAAFALFNDSSEDENEELEQCVQKAILHRNKTSSSISQVEKKDEDDDQHLKKEEECIRRESQKALHCFVKHAPLYMGPMALDMDMKLGGARGYVALHDLQPGTLLLREQVLVPWPVKKDAHLFVDTVAKILEDEKCDEIIQAMKELYPKNLDDLPKELLQAGLEEYTAALQTILDTTSSPYSSTMETLLQLVFAMQSNAFQSGVFLNSSIFNHACLSNCVKFQCPENPSISEVRACRFIAAGEALNINYLSPCEQLKTTRQKQLFEQFGFICICPRCLSESDTPAEFLTLEKQVLLIEQQEEASVPERVLATTLDLFSDALEMMSHDNMMLMRIHRLVANSCVQLLDHVNPQFLEHAILYLRSSVELLDLQKQYLPQDHLDLTRTLKDISNGIQMLLSYDPEILYAEFPEWATFKCASHAENTFRQQYLRLRSLYE